MEVSLLQHAKDGQPKAVGISEIVDMIRGDRWPPGYQPVLLVQGTFEGGTRQQDLTRLSGLALCTITNNREPTTDIRELARADPHTLLLYTVADSLVVIYPYELDVGYEVYLQRQFYQKAFLFGNDYYERLLGAQSVRRGRDAGKRCLLGHDAEAYYNPQAEPFLAWEIKEGCRRQTSQPKSTEGLHERKPNYREVYMSLDEIEQWMKQHIELRRNVITMRKEYRWLEDGCCDDGTPWENFDDIVYNDVWRRLEKVKPTKDEALRKTVDSNYVSEFNPFVEYLRSLPPWDGDDYIRALAMGVTVAGGFDDWCRFVECLRKWLVAMVAGWINPDVVNHEVLVFIGRQGIYKTTWMNHLLPPPLRSYFCTQAGVGDNAKDEELALTQYGLISCEELDTMSTREMNKMKRAVTLSYVNVRPPFGRYTVHRPHIASFCGTGNNEKFLNDPTGTRRWLAFKVENIESPRTLPFEYDGIYSQAYYLYRNGFEYWFSGDETAAIDERNSRFKVANLERQLVYRYYSHPVGTDTGEFVSVGDAMQHIGGNITQKLRKEAVDQAFIDLGFEAMVCDGMPGYRAVRRMPKEIDALGRQMALRAAQPQETENQDPEIPDHF